MTHYGWSTCPVPIRTQVKTLSERLQNMLGIELVSIFLHGSLAMGCFNPERSDLDLLIITAQGLSVTAKRAIMELLLQLSNAPRPIEISFLVLPNIHPFRHPLPFDLHYSEDWRKKTSEELADGSWRDWNKHERYDYDLAAHITITRRRGLILYGKPAIEVLPTVPGEDYARAIIGDYWDARDSREQYPVYFVLNACRVYAYLKGGHIFSKDEGGSYGLDALPATFSGLIQHALEDYRGEGQARPYAAPELATFASFMDQHVHS
ncbi:aminoglycoside adenylyltransferase domain-containing protein [Ktedonosporobacter rubrisoli]|nr:aminoglycoside adenylyltransferase domain-containing protein [Ktedonosporobacter rubrisoli]